MSIAPTGNFTMEHLGNMTYLEMVIKETLRIHPIVPYIERQILEEFELGRFVNSMEIQIILMKFYLTIHFFHFVDGIKYPVGTVFGVPIACMHLDPQHFPDPYKFDPLRFASENLNKIPSYIYLPFSAGPRICIGNF